MEIQPLCIVTPTQECPVLATIGNMQIMAVVKHGQQMTVTAVGPYLVECKFLVGDPILWYAVALFPRDKISWHAPPPS